MYERQVVKIGEGTFGEAVKGNGMVLKIVPMGNEHLKVRASGMWCGVVLGKVARCSRH